MSSITVAVQAGTQAGGVDAFVLLSNKAGVVLGLLTSVPCSHHRGSEDKDRCDGALGRLTSIHSQAESQKFSPVIPGINSLLLHFFKCTGAQAAPADSICQGSCASSCASTLFCLLLHTL